MLHKNRVWGVGNIEDPEHLADMLTSYTWTLCTGFRCGGYLFLNDSFSEDGAQEYGIINESTDMQVESITFSWCSYANALMHINSVVAGYYDNQSIPGGIDLTTQIEPADKHECYLCR